MPRCLVESAFANRNRHQIRLTPAIRAGLAMLGLVLALTAQAAAPPPLWRALTEAQEKEVEDLQSRLNQHASAGEFEVAAKVAQQIAEYRARRQGAGHPEAVDARFEVQEWQRLSQVPAKARAEVVRARQRNNEGVGLLHRGRPREAEKPLREALAIRLKVLGADHPDTAGSYNNVALCLQDQGKAGEALPLYQKALAIREKVLGADHPSTATSHNNVALCLQAQGKAGEALPLYQKALAIREKVLGADHPDTATSYNNVALCLQDQGKAGEALPLLQKALAIREKVLGADHPDTAGSYNNVALCLQDQGKAGEALPLLQKALAIREKVLGADHPDTATSYNNVAYCLQDLGKAGEALPLLQKALAIREKVLGADHPDTATSYNNVASCLQDQGKAGEALPLYQKALAISLKVLGADHPDTATSYNNVASCLQAQGKAGEALPLLQKALAIREKVLGADHPSTAQSYNNVASCLQAQGKAGEALPLYQKALAIRLKVLGADHPSTAQSYNNLAYCLQAQGKAGEALPLYQKALAIRVKVLGADHPDTAGSYNNVASCLQDQGKAGEALPLLQKALAISLKVLGADHPSTARSYNNVALCLQDQGKAGEALPLYQKALAISLKVLGADHPSTATSYNNVASCLEAQGKAGEALPLLQKALAIREKVLGADHPDTATSYNNVASCLNAQGKAGEALPLYQKALAIREKVLGADHPSTATSYNNVAYCLQALGKAGEALPLYQKALAIREKVLGADHPDTAGSYNNVAYCLNAQGKAGEALPLLQKALAISLKVLGADHPSTATSYNNVAYCLQDLGKAGEALPLYQKALAIYQKVLGADHPSTAQSYNNLASCLEAQGKAGEALPLLQKALAISLKVLGADHPDTATSYNNVAVLLHQQGKWAEAAAAYQSAVQGREFGRLAASSSGFDRAQFEANKLSPRAGLATMLVRLNQPVAAWEQAESDLGRGLLDDLLGPEQQSPQDQADLAELNRLDAARLPLLGLQQRNEEQQQQLQTLTQQSRTVQKRLAERAVQRARQRVLSRVEVQRAIPEDAALVFWLDVRGDHLGCVLRHRGEPAWVRLPGSGKEGAWTKEDISLVGRVYQELSRPELSAGERDRLLLALRKQRLDPLDPHLEGVRRLLVVPAGDMAALPIEAITDRYTISYVGSGSIHARQAAQSRPLKGENLLALGDPVFDKPTEKQPEPPPHGLLVTGILPNSLALRLRLRPGDVLLEYNGKELHRPADLVAATGETPVPVKLWREGRTGGGSIPPGMLGVTVSKLPIKEALAAWHKQQQAERVALRGGTQWNRLPGTLLEVRLLEQLIPKSTTLLGSAASEQNLIKLAERGELARYRLLHLATHGEANPTHPENTALILSRDNLPDNVARVRDGKRPIEGSLTVSTILREWKLDADLVVLSACETGLGQYAGSEGMLGFAQALMQRGARSVVLSRWKVDDGATALLMQRFYQNVLGQREGLKAPLGRAEALREAKTWLRSLTSEQALTLLAAINASVARGPGAKELSLKPVKRERSKKEDRPDRPYEHPFYWAAFVLLGDWR